MTNRNTLQEISSDSLSIEETNKVVDNILNSQNAPSLGYGIWKSRTRSVQPATPIPVREAGAIVDKPHTPKKRADHA